MPIPTIINLPARDWTARNGERIAFIVAHGTVGTDSRGWLQGNPQGTSIHVLIAKNGTIYRMLPDERGANHAGYSRVSVGGRSYQGAGVNRASLGFELENLQNGNDPYPEAQLLAMGWQIADWRRQYGPLPISRHADIDTQGKRDPMGLTVPEIETFVKIAVGVGPVDPFTAWGMAGHPIKPHERDWATAHLWLANSWLGAALSDHLYFPATMGGNRVVIVFEAGVIVQMGTRPPQVVRY